MQSTPVKILITLILAVVAIGGSGVWWFFHQSSGTPGNSTFPQNQSSNGPDNSPLTGNTTTVVPGQSTQGSTTQQTPSDSLSATERAYQALFAQLGARSVSFQGVGPGATGDLKTLYGLYAADVKAQKAAAPNASTTIDMALVDLTDDGVPEALVYEDLPYFCGTGGCTLDIYQKKSGRWKKIFSELAGDEVGTANLLVNGYLDLYLTTETESPQGQQSIVVRYRWSGSAYAAAGAVAGWNGNEFLLLK